jgi:hypothetical protein
MNNMNKKYIGIGAAVVVVILLLGGVMVFSKKETKPQNQQTAVQPTSEVVPTVDASVKVTLKPTDASKHELELNIEDMPKGTKTIEYELTYDTQAQGLQGISPGPIDIEDDSKAFTRKFLLGTESSGAKTYHVVTSPIKLNVVFTGNYGKKQYETEITL